MIFSVVVATYNHPGILGKCLKKLVSLKFPKDEYEIILVDNNPGNPKKIPLPDNKGMPRLKTVFEGTSGLAGSRNKGIAESIGDFVAFIDDDALADENYLSVAQKTIVNHLHVSVFGGPIYPFYTSKKPPWFKDEYEARFWGDNERILKKGETFSGSNMIFRKDLFRKFGNFRTSLGMKGEELSLGEETELFSRLNKKGIQFFYIPEMKVSHLVSAYKMTVFYQLKRAYASGSSQFVYLEDNPARAVLSFFKYTGGLIVFSIRASVRIFSHNNFKQWLVEELSPVFYAAGYIIRSVGIKIRIKR
ncbi:MAG: family 2 glycosyl transferase [Candidatus Gottesmanbacteria bacterium GW2011_GWA2_43_14]|uniref:Family 2 glycosyl transferase n=1 Tax=Candidatus Gottesmanbacteria bacterium GW2011_GWA2_43_14 TaxID=1618443 RepID=A0A0G1DLA4_9BACT|nr:MAG: family 2 glycosyl transferase [Candidatus Gottesmanbacteria bacterium GW2011_GWA2_43_14]